MIRLVSCFVKSDLELNDALKRTHFWKNQSFVDSKVDYCGFAIDRKKENNVRY